MSGIHAARVAARIRRELKTDVEMVKGHYGEYKVLVDGRLIVNGGAKAVMGILPSAKKVVESVRARLEEAPGAATPRSR